jgi:alkanesulfonate monooxygenase SsuD/methylene tetrahydromethanopterin reductase-like flavin-dependent oxidoreductase (luciferase family)
MREAEAMGFDYLLIQEHFFTQDGYSPSVPVFLALLIERTRSVRIGSYTYLLPLHNAAQLAQETAVLDHLSDGRLDVCVGAGHRPLEYSAFGFSPKSRPSRMEEGLQVLKLAWMERPFSFQGRYYDLKNLTVTPEPLQKPHPPLWIAATSIAAAERAGRYGAHLHGASTEPAFHDAYLRALVAAGHDRAQARISNGWSITVTREDPNKVWERNKQLYFERWDFYRTIRAEMGDPEIAFGLPAIEGYRGNELIGSADVVLGQLHSFASRLPLTDIVHAGPASGIPIRGEAYESLKAFADDVMPEIKAWQ